MKISVKNVPAIIAFILFMSFLPSCEKTGREQERSPELKIGIQAPDFTLEDLNGKDVRLSDYPGKIILLEFWATWCPPCRAAVPELISLQNKYDKIGFVVLGVAIDEGGDSRKKLAEFAGEYEINYAVLIGNDEVSRLYSVRSIPTSFLIDRNGLIAEKYMGYIDSLEARISEKVETID